MSDSITAFYGKLRQLGICLLHPQSRKGWAPKPKTAGLKKQIILDVWGDNLSVVTRILSLVH